MNTPETTTKQPAARVRMTVTKQCGGSVRFDAPKPGPGQAPQALSNVYVNRTCPDINPAQEIEVTITVIR